MNVSSCSLSERKWSEESGPFSPLCELIIFIVNYVLFIKIIRRICLAVLSWPNWRIVNEWWALEHQPSPWLCQEVWLMDWRTIVVLWYISQIFWSTFNWLECSILLSELKNKNGSYWDGCNLIQFIAIYIYHLTKWDQQKSKSFQFTQTFSYHLILNKILKSFLQTFKTYKPFSNIPTRKNCPFGVDFGRVGRVGSSGGINILPAGNHGQGAKNSCGNASIWETINNVLFNVLPIFDPFIVFVVLLK